MRAQEANGEVGPLQPPQRVGLAHRVFQPARDQPQQAVADFRAIDLAQVLEIGEPDAQDAGARADPVRQRAEGRGGLTEGVAVGQSGCVVVARVPHDPVSRLDLRRDVAQGAVDLLGAVVGRVQAFQRFAHPAPLSPPVAYAVVERGLRARPAQAGDHAAAQAHVARLHARFPFAAAHAVRDLQRADAQAKHVLGQGGIGKAHRPALVHREWRQRRQAQGRGDGVRSRSGSRDRVQSGHALHPIVECLRVCTASLQKRVRRRSPVSRWQWSP